MRKQITSDMVDDIVIEIGDAADAYNISNVSGKWTVHSNGIAVGQYPTIRKAFADCEYLDGYNPLTDCYKEVTHA